MAIGLMLASLLGDQRGTGALVNSHQTLASSQGPYSPSAVTTSATTNARGDPGVAYDTLAYDMVEAQRVVAQRAQERRTYEEYRQQYLAAQETNRHALSRGERMRIADIRGLALLIEHLTPAQQDSYDRSGYFDVIGGSTGLRYRIYYGRTYNVTQFNGDVAACKLCFGPGGDLCMGDFLLAQKICLEADEDATLRIANRNNIAPTTLAQGLSGGTIIADDVWGAYDYPWMTITTAGTFGTTLALSDGVSADATVCPPEDTLF